MVRFTLALLILSMVFWIKGIAQNSFTPGYVISSSGDTIKRDIDYRAWDKNPRSVRFTREGSTTTETLDPLSVKVFSVQNDTYAGAIVKVETSPHEDSRLDFTPSFSIRKDTILLRALVVGDKSLFYYKLADGDEKFYIKESNEYTLLLFKRYKSRTGTKLVIHQNRRYQGQLALILNDFPRIEARVKGDSYIYRNPTTFRSAEHTIGYKQVRLNNLFQFRPISNKTWYLQLGLSNGFAFDEIDEGTVDDTYYTVCSVSEGKAVESIRRDGRFERGQGFSSAALLESYSTRYSLLLLYRLEQ